MTRNRDNALLYIYIYIYIDVYTHFFLGLGQLILDEHGNIELKENVIVADEELALHNQNVLEISNTLAQFFRHELL